VSVSVRFAVRTLSVVASVLASSCSTAGNTWLNQSSTADDAKSDPAALKVTRSSDDAQPDPDKFRTQIIGGEDDDTPQSQIRQQQRAPSLRAPILGNVLGTFRNTYYDFPTESDFTGDSVSIRDAKCGAIQGVPRGFFEALCVQGSGTLKSGQTVSFAKRNCDCADVCPKTGEKICFEALESSRFPWGRGALGTPITPLLTVAVDDTVIPMGTALYIPEFDGLPLDAQKTRFHDGCFIAQDRGLRVKGQHVDVFTGFSAMTALWNQLVPSNHGVTVVTDSPKCARAEQ
jgi:3D (Asp-Asp-Asp) domain-containing protein